MTAQEIQRLKWRQASNRYNARHRKAPRPLAATPDAEYMRGYRRGVRLPRWDRRGPDGRFVRRES